MVGWLQLYLDIVFRDQHCSSASGAFAFQSSLAALTERGAPPGHRGGVGDVEAEGCLGMGRAGLAHIVQHRPLEIGGIDLPALADGQRLCAEAPVYRHPVLDLGLGLDVVLDRQCFIAHGTVQLFPHDLCFEFFAIFRHSFYLTNI